MELFDASLQKAIFMKMRGIKGFILAALVLMAVSVWSQEKSTLTVVIKKVKNENGVVAVALYNKEGDFMKKHIDAKQVKAKKGEVTITFENLPAGEYAMTVMHDENENKKPDTNSIGMPKEGFGFSNDAMGTFGPPSFAKAKFTHQSGGITITVNLRYL